MKPVGEILRPTAPPPAPAVDIDALLRKVGDALRARNADTRKMLACMAVELATRERGEARAKYLQRALTLLAGP